MVVIFQEIGEEGLLDSNSGEEKVPNWLVIDEAVYDDNSYDALHPDTIQKLQLFRGDTILIKVSDLRDFYVFLFLNLVPEVSLCLFFFFG